MNPATANNISKPPAHTRVIIIGGGVVGVSAAVLLAERGIPVVLFEKGCIAGEQSSRNWGWIRRQGRDMAELPLMNESLALWKRFAAEVDTDIGFKNGGISYLAETEKEMESHRSWLSDAQQLVPDSRLLNSQQTNTLAGRSDKHFVGGLYTPGDCFAEPTLAVPALARLAQSKGAQLFENQAVRGFLRQAGRVIGVVTESGTVKCDSVILAGGIWSRVMLENEGLSFAQLAVRSSVLRTSPVPPIASCTLGATAAALRPRADGGYTIARTSASRFDMIPAAISHLPAFFPMLRKEWPNVKIHAGKAFFGPLGRQRWQLDQQSPFEQVRTMDPAPDTKRLSEIMQSAKSLFPAISKAKVMECWAGMIDFTPDEIAVVSPVPSVGGLVLASGMSGHGFGFGPGAGLLAAQLAIDETPVVDTQPLALSRLKPSTTASAA
ncbi:MAG: FAD-binding oxidoreductase [Granulosicoccus sp.]|nr:FAD-binding oxidoreductase [Granulosicoccus sp.]